MICVTIGRTRHKHAIAEYQSLAEAGVELVELRLDYIGRSIDLTRLIKDRPIPCVITCRRKEDGGRWEKTEEERLMMLRSAIASGVEYVDLEEDIAAKVPRYGKTKRIVSLHDFDGTPEDLESIPDRLARLDADIVKVAALANSFADVIRMMRTMESAKVPMIGISMGDIGTVTRLLAHRFGAPFTYSTTSSERKVAPGMLTYAQMKELYRVDTIDKDTKIFGVVADPVAHSYSPLIHNTAFQHQQLNARYLPFRVPAEDLSIFLQWCKQFGIGGISVTIPHKESILPMLTQAEASAQEIGAVNTVRFDGEDAIGYNTDYRAAMDCLTEAMKHFTKEEEPFKGRTILILGAGGVSRAIAYGLRQRGALIEIASRTMARSEELARSIGGKAIPWESRHSVKAAAIVNGTPIGMFPEMEASPYDASKLDDRTFVFDTIYNPDKTMFAKQARAKGCHVLTGSYMFIRQASYQYKLFTGKEPPTDVMRAVLQKALSPVNY